MVLREGIRKKAMAITPLALSDAIGKIILAIKERDAGLANPNHSSFVF